MRAAEGAASAPGLVFAFFGFAVLYLVVGTLYVRLFRGVATGPPRGSMSCGRGARSVLEIAVAGALLLFALARGEKVFSVRRPRPSPGSPSQRTSGPSGLARRSHRSGRRSRPRSGPPGS